MKLMEGLLDHMVRDIVAQGVVYLDQQTKEIPIYNVLFSQTPLEAYKSFTDELPTKNIRDAVNFINLNLAGLGVIKGGIGLYNKIAPTTILKPTTIDVNFDNLSKNFPQTHPDMKKIIQTITYEDLNQYKHISNILGGTKLDGTSAKYLYFDRQIKGIMAELYIEEYFKKQGYEALPSKLPDNKGLDHVFVKMEKGIVQEIQIVETKYSANSLAQLNKGQMGMEWIENQIKELKGQGVEYKKTAEIIQ